MRVEKEWRSTVDIFVVLTTGNLDVVDDVSILCVYKQDTFCFISRSLINADKLDKMCNNNINVVKTKKNIRKK